MTGEREEGIHYTLRRSKRAKYVRLRVLPGGLIVVTAPVASAPGMIRRFIASRTEWIQWAVQRMMQFKALPVSGRRAYVKHKEEARAFVRERVAHWNVFYGFSHNRIAIKNTKRTWGSCSRKGNLNFSYSLLFLPREIADYVVVHELCHLKEHNHSRDFWMLVSRALPNYRHLKRELRRYAPQG